MKRIFISILTIFVVVGLLASASPVNAQGVASLTATVDRNTLTVDDTFLLTLTLFTPDSSMPQLTLPQLDEFRVIGNSQSLQTSIINGAMSTTAIYTYQLQPVRTGNLEIPGFSLDWNGQMLSTNPISITVSQGKTAAGNPSAPSAQSPSGATQPDISVKYKRQQRFIH